MEFTAKITREDFMRCQQYAIGRINTLPAMKLKITVFSVVYWGLLSAFVVLLLYQYENVHGVERTRLIVAATIFAAWIAASCIWQRYYFTQMCKEGVEEDGTVLGNWRFTANDDGLKEENERCSSFFHWGCFKSVEEDAYGLYLFTDRLKAVIVPKSQVEEHILANLKEYVTRHSSQPVSVSA